MKSFFLVLLTVAATPLFVGCRNFNSLSPENTGQLSIAPKQEVPEYWNFNFDSRPWEVGYQAADAQQAIHEYVLKGQTIDNWSELVTSQFVARSVPPRALADAFIRGMSNGCPSLRVNILVETSDTIILEWKHDGCQGYPPQNEIRRISRARGGTLILAFVEKTPLLTAEKRSTWLAIIKSAAERK